MCSREDSRKKRIEEEVRKKVESEKKAHEIVTSLLETNIQESYFVKSVAIVTESHYQDVTEERAILSICGFALCDNKLKNVPKQKFKIHRNKVFDLENRKHFCSELCYKRSNDVKGQIPGLPMWLRDENNMEPIRLHRNDNSGLKGDEIQIAPELSLDNVQTLGFKNTESDSFEDLPAFSTGVNKKKNVKFEKVIEIKPTCRSVNSSVKESVLEILKSWLTVDSLHLLNRTEENVDAAKQEKLKRLHENLNKVVMGSVNEEDNQNEKRPKTEIRKLEMKSNEVYMERVERFLRGGFDLQHKAKAKTSNQEDNDEVVKAILPEVDSKNQVNIRRRILSEKLLKVIKDLVPRLPNVTVFGPLRTLVKTFNISSKNVKLQTHEYPIIGICLLILLRERFHEIKEYFIESETNFELILKTYSTSVTELNYQVEELIKFKMNE